ncbi:uncharacterized protein O3C94_015395 [Discoglossus pictus]
MDSSSSDTEDPASPLLPPTPPPVDDDYEDDDDGDDDDPFAVLTRVTVSPESIPWEQRSTKMKIVHIADRIFIAFLFLFALVLFAEVCYILYFAVPWEMLYKGLMHWLLTQEEAEEELDL